MRNVELYADGRHKFVLLNESEPGEEDGVRSNQYLICEGGSGILIDPGGFGVMPRVLGELLRHIRPENLAAIVLSHQDPDIVGGLSTWLQLSPAQIYVSRIWLRFLPHYGLQEMSRFIGVPDTGLTLELAPDARLRLVPAHFLHSEGQFNVYDPRARILFTGDIGAAMLPPHCEQIFVDDFETHIPYIRYFHQRFMANNQALRCWLETISGLEIEMLAPQHGPIYRGAAVPAFLEWLRELRCGTDLMQTGGAFALEGA